MAGGWSKEMLAKFAAPKGSWKCEVCLVQNPPTSLSQCVSCESARDADQTGKRPRPSDEEEEKQQHNKKKQQQNSGGGFSFPTNPTAEGGFSFGFSSSASSVVQSTAGFSFGVVYASETPKGTDLRQLPAHETNGCVYAVGLGDCGQLGCGEDQMEIETFTKIPSLSKLSMRQIACGGMHTLALASDDKQIYSWGCNDDEALGRTGDENYPHCIKNFHSSEITQISAGDCHSAALTAAGELYTWGTYRDDNGYLGYNSSTLKQPTPHLVYFSLRRGLHQPVISHVACGYNHTLAVSKTGQVFSWGSGAQNQTSRRVNPRHKESQLLPQLVNLGRHKRHRVLGKKVYCGGFHSFVISECEGVYAFGLNNFGQLGVGNKLDDYMKPTRLAFFEEKKVKQLDGGMHHSAALCEDGSVYTFGRCDSGQLGIQLTNQESQLSVESPTFVGGLPQYIYEISCGGNHTMALSCFGNLYAWGFGEMNQLGDGKDSIQYTPIEVHLQSDATPILGAQAGGQFSIVLGKN